MRIYSLYSRGSYLFSDTLDALYAWARRYKADLLVCDETREVSAIWT